MGYLQKPHYKVLLLAVFATPILLFAGVHAQSAEPEVTAQTKEQRIEARKQAASTRLTNAQQNRLQQRCKNAQVKLDVVVDKAATFGQNRVKMHSTLVGKLELVLQKGALSDVSKAKLTTEIATLKAQVTQLDAVIAEYQQALSDAADIDCASDPSGFSSSLVAARQSRVEMLKQVAATRAHIKDSIVPTLNDIKSQKAVTDKGDQS